MTSSIDFCAREKRERELKEEARKKRVTAKRSKKRKPKAVLAWGLFGFHDGKLREVFMSRSSAQFHKGFYLVPKLVVIRRVRIEVIND